jgi:anti-sigma B factor antagonist
MSFGVETRETDGIVVLHLSGRLVAGHDISDLRALFETLIARKENRIVLNLKHLEFMDSSGLGVLVNGYTSAANAGGAVKLSNIPKRAAELLILTKLSTVFEIYEDEQSAINSFFPERAIKHFDILEFVKTQQDNPKQ